MSFFGLGPNCAGGNGAGNYALSDRSTTSVYSRYFGGRAPSGSLKKTQFYVWFLGSKPSHGLRGREYVTPAVGELLDEGGRHPPPCKVTVRVSEKGMKIVQSVPAIGRRSGKLKMEQMKLIVPPHSITFASIGPRPYTDVVSCILLLWNPQTRCPVHIHVYRCDSPETASLMHAALQILVDRPQNQRALMDVERRLMARGLLTVDSPPHHHHYQPRRQKAPQGHPYGHQRTPRISSLNQENTKPFYELPADYSVEDVIIPKMDRGRIAEESRSVSTGRGEGEESTDRVTRLHQAVFNELKTKLQSKGPLLLPPKDYSLRFVKSGLPANFLAAAWAVHDRTTPPPPPPMPAARTDHSPLPIQPARSEKPSGAPGARHSSDELTDGRRKLRLFGDTLRLNKANDQPPADALNRQTDHWRRRLAASSTTLSTVAAPVAPAPDERPFQPLGDNWLIARPRFVSMQNLAFDRSDDSGMESMTTTTGTSGGGAGGSSSSSYPQGADAYRQKRLRRHPNPPMVCDPFGRKYERRTTVKNFWKNVQMPTRIEDNYGVWYLAPSDHCFP